MVVPTALALLEVHILGILYDISQEIIYISISSSRELASCGLKKVTDMIICPARELFAPQIKSRNVMEMLTMLTGMKKNAVMIYCEISEFHQTQAHWLLRIILIGSPILLDVKFLCISSRNVISET